MKKKHQLIFVFFAIHVAVCYTANAQIGRVGINTTTPSAMLHVKDSSVVFTGPASLPGSPGNPPVSGAGIRMMWYPDKAAFRVGRVTTTYWNKDSIGNYSFASGYNSKAIGDYSTAMGNGSIASGDNSTALGLQAIASGYISTAFGTGKATGLGSTALGYITTASGDYSTALGYITTASGDFSTSMGFETTARPYASFTIGRYNDSISSSSLSSWVATDPVFIIGNGTANNARSNALTVLKNGKTGINTISPDAMLHIVGNGSSGGGYNGSAGVIIENNATSYIQFSHPNAGSTGLLSGNASTSIRSGIIFLPDSSISFRAGGNNTRMLLSNTGDLNIDGVYSSSDARLKKNINPLQNSLQKILRLNGYHYIWIDNSRNKDLQTGVLAQEVEQQMPELVKTDADGMKSVNYSGMIPYLIEAVKELKQENEILKEEIKKLKGKQR